MRDDSNISKLRIGQMKCPKCGMITSTALEDKCLCDRAKEIEKIKGIVNGKARL